MSESDLEKSQPDELPEVFEPDAPDPSLTDEELEVTYPPEGDVPEIDDDPDVEILAVIEPEGEVSK